MEDGKEQEGEEGVTGGVNEGGRRESKSRKVKE